MNEHVEELSRYLSGGFPGLAIDAVIDGQMMQENIHSSRLRVGGGEGPMPEKIFCSISQLAKSLKLLSLPCNHRAD